MSAVATKKAPAKKEELGVNEKKRLVAAELVKAGAGLLAHWSPSRHGGVTVEEAQEYLAHFLGYVPQGVWDERLGARKYGRPAPVKKATPAKSNGHRPAQSNRRSSGNGKPAAQSNRKPAAQVNHKPAAQGNRRNGNGHAAK